MFKRVMFGALLAVLAAALPVACSSSKSGSGGGGSAGASGSSGSGGTAGSAGTDGGSSGGAGGIPPYQDAALDAPYKLPDGGCGQTFCPAAVAAQCPKGGFQSLNDCVKFCSQVPAKCSNEWNALLTCAGPNPSISCNSSGQLTVDGCANEQQAFIACAIPAADGG